MDIVINPRSWDREQLGAPEARLDWHGLRARFAASHAMRREWGGKTPAKPGNASFHREAAQILSAYATTQEAGLTAVNPTALVDGNSQGGKNVPVAGKKWPVVEDEE